MPSQTEEVFEKWDYPEKTDLFYYFKIAKNKAILLLMAAACWSYLGERLVPVADCGEDLGGPRREV